MKLRCRALAAAMSVCLAVTAFPVSLEPMASEPEESDDGYSLVWEDEFEGDSLNRDYWNVETHEAGWVNSELQEYVDSDENIQVKDGKLYIYPQETTTTVTTGASERDWVRKNANNIVSNGDFSAGETDWNIGITSPAEGTYSIDNGALTYSLTNIGTEEWHVQLKHSGISLGAGKTYVGTYKIKSTEARDIKSGVMSADYNWYGGSDYSLSANEEKTVSFKFTMDADDANADFYISMGAIGSSVASDITISDVVIYETKLDNTTFAGDDPMSGWTETIANWSDIADASSSVSDGKITYTINKPGTEDWNVQLKQENVSLEAGKTYVCSYVVSSTKARQIKSGVMSTSYSWYGGSDPVLEENKETLVRFEFTMGADDPSALFYISMGGIEGTDTPASTITISNINLYEKSASISSLETYTTSGSTTVTSKSYTSGRISTQNKETFTYGRFEARVKVPEGQGYLPAFWLMANDENVYGQWPRCGEIDCMEVMGQDTSKVYGTIHYGNPHSESQGTKTLEANAFSSGYHTFTCDWEPGKITWYVDGVKYYEESDWYSTTEGQGTLTYPAPFDQPFYIILNLAVGGSWVGNPDDTTSFDDNPYIIDYVRVYQKEAYDENVTKPVKEVTLRDPDTDGNYINNGNFSDDEDLTDDTNWKFLLANGGEATATIDDNELDIETTDAGTVNYSVQLVQANVPLLKGATYEIQFDAYADEARTMDVDVKAPDHGYKQYMTTQVPALTTEKQTYTYTFKMKDDSDENARLEFNMGAGSTAAIHLSNVSIKKIADPDPNEIEEKTVLSDGNYIYNGSFQEGTGHLGYWDIDKKDGIVNVTNYADGRRLHVEVPEDSEMATISQTDLAFTEGQVYKVTLSADTDEATNLRLVIGGNKYKIPLEVGKHDYTFKIPATASFADKDITIKFEAGSDVYIDDIKMTEASLIKNGSFDNGTTNYTTYKDDAAKATFSADDGELAVKVTNPADADYKVQVKQENVELIKGHEYTLKYKVKSTVDRYVRVILQGGESLGWPVYSSDNIVSANGEYTEYTDTFVMGADTDSDAFLSICLGKVDSPVNLLGASSSGGTDYLTTEHTVYIDDISLVDNTASVGDDEFTKYIDLDLNNVNNDDDDDDKDNSDDKDNLGDLKVINNNSDDSKVVNNDSNNSNSNNSNSNDGNILLVKNDANTSNNSASTGTSNKAAVENTASKKGNPKTGDRAPIAVVIGVMFVAGGACIVLKKKKTDEE